MIYMFPVGPNTTCESLSKRYLTLVTSVSKRKRK